MNIITYFIASESLKLALKLQETMSNRKLNLRDTVVKEMSNKSSDKKVKRAVVLV